MPLKLQYFCTQPVMIGDIYYDYVICELGFDKYLITVSFKDK